MSGESEAAPPPDLLSLIPIRKTRAGLQFSCAAPTIGLNNHNLKDVWVCNSDGYVGQVRPTYVLQPKSGNKYPRMNKKSILFYKKYMSVQELRSTSMLFT